jgi:SSS family solute:Na+ symporter
MQLQFIDYLVFAAFIVAVVVIGIVTSPREQDTAAYFLAGRGLPWWLIGFSLIAANISSEQFVGMSGNAADRLGLAIASFEWLAAITLVVVAFFFLPYFLRTGIYTIPEFLERRFNRTTRSLMAVSMVLIYVLLIAAVIYSGALTIETAFGGQRLFGWLPMNLTAGVWLIGGMAAIYVACGGLKACAWADLIQGSALIIGGAIVLYFSLKQLGQSSVASLVSLAPIPAGLTDSDSGIEKFAALNAHKLHLVLPGTDTFLPWTTLLMGLWIPNFYYWGLNQYIMQRTLGSRSLAQGQKGIVFAAGMKLLIPFIIVLPGMIAFNLFSREMQVAAQPANERALQRYAEAKAHPNHAPTVFVADSEWRKINPAMASELDAYNEIARKAAAESGIPLKEEKLVAYRYDTAFGHLISHVLPTGSGWRGFVLAALLGAVVSTLASMLNAASTIVTMDLYRPYLAPTATQPHLVGLGRISVGVFSILGCIIAPGLGNPRVGNSIFVIIQESQAYIYPGIFAVFLIGIIARRAPSVSGTVGLVLGPLASLAIREFAPEISFLNRASLAFAIVIAVMLLMTKLSPLAQPAVLAATSDVDLTPSRSAKILGLGVIGVTLLLYLMFW